jgi:signal transduction histidine kinase
MNADRPTAWRGWRHWCAQLAGAKREAVFDLLLAMAIANALVFALMGVSAVATLSNSVTLLVLAGLGLARRLGWVRLDVAVLALTWVGYVDISAVVVAHDGLWSEAMIWYVVLPLPAMLVLSIRAALPFVALIALTIVGLLVAHNASWFDPYRTHVRPLSWSVVVFVGLTLSVWALPLVYHRARAMLERDLQQRQQMLDALQHRLGLEQAQKDQLIANVSHELRTPVNAIIGLLQTIDRQQLPNDDARQSMQHIEQAAVHLSVIINDLLDLAQLQAGRLELRPRVFELQPRIEQVIGPFVQQLKSKGVTFELSWSETLPRWVEGDPVRMAQVLVNLLGNATKFTQRGRVHLDVRPAPGAADCVQWQVQDTGMGIDAAQLNRIFERFGALGPGSAHGLGGAGIGLSLTKQLVGLMHGHIEVRSEVGEGSTFTFVVPLPERAPPQHQSSPNPQPPIDQSLQARVLLVEDNAINRLVAKQLLRRELPSLQIDEATDGPQALRLAAEQRYDLILMDVVMPHMSGVEVTELLCANNDGQTPPILGLTADPNPELHQRCRVAGMREVYLKPYIAADLARDIAHLILQSRQG